MKGFTIFCVALFFGQLSSASAESIYEVGNNFLKITERGSTKTCKLDGRPLYAIVSYDGSAIIVSGRGYVPKRQLDNCKDSPLHVSSIPSGVGFLSDINLQNNIYISLDLISARPPRYLATIAHIGENKNLVSINGAYVKGVSTVKLRRYGFTSAGEAGASVISVDGRYIAANGVIDCSDDANPMPLYTTRLQP